METKVYTLPQPELGWIATAKKRHGAVVDYLQKTFGVNKDKWHELRFEYMCRYAEMHSSNYHLLIADEQFRVSFLFQWAKHDFALADNRITGDYKVLKEEVLFDKDIERFIFSHI
ncbi:MAG: hypothetical protein KF872_06080 [Chitinophagales bacterium]|nr:hypothetical protein [Chitinophagales bacterium]